MNAELQVNPITPEPLYVLQPCDDLALWLIAEAKWKAVLAYDAGVLEGQNQVTERAYDQGWDEGYKEGCHDVCGGELLARNDIYRWLLAEKRWQVDNANGYAEFLARGYASAKSELAKQRDIALWLIAERDWQLAGTRKLRWHQQDVIAKSEYLRTTDAHTHNEAMHLARWLLAESEWCSSQREWDQNGYFTELLAQQEELARWLIAEREWRYKILAEDFEGELADQRNLNYQNMLTGSWLVAERNYQLEMYGAELNNYVELADIAAWLLAESEWELKRERAKNADAFLRGYSYARALGKGE